MATDSSARGARRGVVADPYARGGDPYAPVVAALGSATTTRPVRTLSLYRGNGDGTYRTVSFADNAQEDEDHRALRRARANHRARQILTAEERASGGDESIFVEVNWADVCEKLEVPLDEDGVFLCERIHWLSGPAGGGKTLLGYWKLLQRARRSQHSAIYECEMGEELAMGLLRNLGATDEDLPYVHYFRAAEDGAVIDLVAHGRAFCRMLLRRGIMAALYDALNPLMVAAERNENVAADVRAWVTAACLPLSMAGGLVLVLDHTGRENEGRSRGSSDKPAAGHVDLVLSKVEPFARGRSGAIRLTCNKDRTGSIVDGATLDIQVEASADGSLRLKPGAWDMTVLADLGKGIRSGTTQQKIAAQISHAGHALSMTEIADLLDMKYDAVRSAVRRGERGKKAIFVQLADERIDLIDRSGEA